MVQSHSTLACQCGAQLHTELRTWSVKRTPISSHTQTYTASRHTAQVAASSVIASHCRVMRCAELGSVRSSKHRVRNWTPSLLAIFWCPYQTLHFADCRLQLFGPRWLIDSYSQIVLREGLLPRTALFYNDTVDSIITQDGVLVAHLILRLVVFSLRINCSEMRDAVLRCRRGIEHPCYPQNTSMHSPDST